MKKGILIVLGMFAVGPTTQACAGDTYEGRDILTDQQRTEALAKLKNAREARLERLRSIDDAALIENLEWEEFYLFHGKREDLYFDDQAYGLSYSSEQFLRIGDYESVDAFLQAYLNNFVAWYLVPAAKSLWITPPFSFPFYGQIHFTEIVMEDGEVKSLPGSSRERLTTDAIHYHFREERSIDDPKPVAVRGEFSTTLPEDVLQFQFAAEDVDKTIEKEGYSVTLRRFTEFAFDVEIQVPAGQQLPLRDEDIVGEAVSPHERYVSLRSEKYLRSDYYAQKEAWLDDVIERARQGEINLQTLNAERDALEERLRVVDETTLHKAFAFYGSIETAQLSLLPRASAGLETYAFEIPFYYRPTDHSDLSVVSDTVLEGPVYQHWSQSRDDLTAEEMQQLIRIGYETQDHEHPYFDHAEKVYLNYPSVHSQLYITEYQRYRPNTQAAEATVEFFDAEGERIELPDRDDLFAFTSESFDYNPQYFPAWPARVTATLPVLTAPNIIRQSYSQDQLPDGLHLEGNRLIVDYEVFVPDERLDSTLLGVPNFNYFFAQDETQAYLKQAGQLIEISQEDREPEHVFYFYGHPESIEIWYQGKTEVVYHELDVELREQPEDYVPAEYEETVSVRAQYEQRLELGESRLKRLGNIKDQELARFLIDEEQANQSDMLDSIVTRREVEYFRYTQSQLMHLQDYSHDMVAMTDAYLQSLMVFNQGILHCESDSDGQVLEFKKGFEFPFRHQLTYTQTLWNDGTVQQFSDIEDATQDNDSSCLEGPISEPSSWPVRITGEFNATLPAELIEFELTAADVGETFEKSGYLVTLLEFGKGNYAVDIDAVDGKPIEFTHEDILAEAIDKHGQYITMWTTQHESPARVQAVNQLLDNLVARAEQGRLSAASAREDLATLQDTLDKEQGRSLYLAGAFYGELDKALITLAPYTDASTSIRQEFELPVYDLPHSNIADTDTLQSLPLIPLTAPVYSARAELRTSVVDLNAQQMQQRIAMVQPVGDIGKPSAEAEYPNQISWFYPPVQSDLLIAGQRLFTLAKLEFVDVMGDPVRNSNYEDLEEADADSECNTVIGWLMGFHDTWPLVRSSLLLDI